MDSARRDFSVHQNWRDHRAEQTLRRWRAAQDAAGWVAFVTGALLATVLWLGVGS